MGLLEECVGIDGKILNEVLIPVMNVSRKCLDGTTHPEETLNKSQIYVTTAGWKGTFAYDKLIFLLVGMVTQPDKYFIMGGTWRIPVLMKLLDRSFLQDLKRDGTYNEASFDREYKQICTRKTIVNCGKLLRAFNYQSVIMLKIGQSAAKPLYKGRFND